MRILKLTEDTRKDILQNLLKRSPNNYGEFEGRVNAIIEEVRNNRDQAVFNYTKQFDGADINAGNILVTEEEIAEAYEQVEQGRAVAHANVLGAAERGQRFLGEVERVEIPLLVGEVRIVCKILERDRGTFRQGMGRGEEHVRGSGE